MMFWAGSITPVEPSCPVPACDVSTQDASYCSSGKVEVRSVRYGNKAELYILKTFLNNIVSFDINLVNLEQVSFIE